MTTRRIKATVINLEQEVPKVGGDPYLMISEKAAVNMGRSQTPSQVVGTAQGILGRKVSNLFTWRATGGGSVGSGAAMIQALRGRTLKWSQKLRALYDTSICSYEGATGIFTLTTNGITSYTEFLADNASVFVSGHIYIGVLNVITNHDNILDFVMAQAEGGLQLGNKVIVSQSGKAVFYSRAQATNSGAFRLIISLKNYTVEGRTAQFTYNVFDVTDMFGAGHEPATVEEFSALYNAAYYAYNPGALLPFKGTGLLLKDANDTEISTLSLPVTTATAKLNGEGESVVPFADGANGFGSNYDQFELVNGMVVAADKVMGIRDYEAGDESDASVLTDLTKTVYVLDAPEHYIFDTPFPVCYEEDRDGTETLLPTGVDDAGAPLTAPMDATIAYPLNADQFTSAASLKNLLEALKTAGVISAYTMAWNSTTEAYDFTVTS